MRSRSLTLKRVTRKPRGDRNANKEFLCLFRRYNGPGVLWNAVRGWELCGGCYDDPKRRLWDSVIECYELPKVKP